MNQLALVLRQSNERMQKIIQGEYKNDQIQDAQREAEIQIKAVNTVFQAYAVMSKNARAKGELANMNIIDPHTYVDLALGDPEVDKIKCVEQRKVITRSECLDYSGDHDCSDCKNFKITREMLLPA